MNNRGQSLISFVLLIPILLLILYMVYEIGRMALLRNSLDGINYLAVDYALDNIDTDHIQDKVETLILKNKDDIDNIIVTIDDDKVYITLRDRLNSKTTLFKNSKVFSVKSSYVGYMENEKKIIERDK